MKKVLTFLAKAIIAAIGFIVLIILIGVPTTLGGWIVKFIVMGLALLGVLWLNKKYEEYNGKGSAE